MSEILKLSPGCITLAQCRQIARTHRPVTLDPSTLAAIDASCAAVRAAVAGGAPAYGINTGFGKLAKTHIPDAQLEQLQDNLVRSHAVGTGRLLEVATALALRRLFEAEALSAAAVLSGALSVDAARGSDAPFDPRIHAVRGQPGQIAVAEQYRALLAGSEIRQSHRVNDDRVQDPYS